MKFAIGIVRIYTYTLDIIQYDIYNNIDYTIVDKASKTVNVRL